MRGHCRDQGILRAHHPTVPSRAGSKSYLRLKVIGVMPVGPFWQSRVPHSSHPAIESASPSLFLQGQTKLLLWSPSPIKYPVEKESSTQLPQTSPPNPPLLPPQLHPTTKKKGATNPDFASSSSSSSVWGSWSPCLHPPPPSALLARSCPVVLPLRLSRVHGTGMLVPLLRWVERRCQYPREPGGTPCPHSPCA